ncbi:unnamed protein product [Lactuca saligna]|uniref:Pentatricopeptide repeat-containing protein n=1 Tax=Lactuca saligna TaxID=75948 RepID=A0AA35V295_LACSI|nr:unnamed protein product [Lactuca saligna]
MPTEMILGIRVFCFFYRPSLALKLANPVPSSRRESLNAPGCDAIHIIEIETDIDYDTFIPSINTSEFQLWYSSFPQLENGIRHSFTTYVRVKSSGIEAPKVNGSLSECHSDSPKFDARMFSLTNRNNLEGPKNGKASTLTISKKLKLEDLIGYDLAVAVSKEFATAFPDRTFISPIVDLLRKNWRNGNLTVAMTDEEIVEIVLFPVVNEACRVLEEKIVVKASDLDIASVLGMSFRSYRCGIVFWADVGSKHIYTGDDSSIYTLLANIYVSVGRWEDVMKVRRKMRGDGVRKEPGCSSIEVNGNVYEFLAGDASHPEMNDIYFSWNTLFKQSFVCEKYDVELVNLVSIKALDMLCR